MRRLRFALLAATVWPTPAPAQVVTVLHSFAGGPGDGQGPRAGLVQSGSTLYGTTEYGGSGNGVLFQVNTDGTGYGVLHSFSGSDGSYPQAYGGSMIQSGSTLYGVTAAGGTSNNGTVFRVNTDGSGFNVLYNFAGAPPGGSGDGAEPVGRLVQSGSTLYGVTFAGGNGVELNGSGGSGTIFKINTDGTGYNVLHAFAPRGSGATNSDGKESYGSLVLSGSSLYGTAIDGGTTGMGTVYKVNTDGTGFTVLHTFTGGGGGAYPTGPLVQSGSTLYGMTTGAGGVSPFPGTIFRVNTDGTGFTVLHTFGLGTGIDPPMGLLLSGSTLFGMTSTGGAAAMGTLFQIKADGSGFTTLYSFTGSPDGAFPQDVLIHSGSTFYGTTVAGGAFSPLNQGNGGGTVFSFTVPVPEPSSLLLVAAAGPLAWLVRRRRSAVAG